MIRAGLGLEDVLDLALQDWSPRAIQFQRGQGGPFGAAGPCGAKTDSSMIEAIEDSSFTFSPTIPFPRTSSFEIDATTRLFLTDLGQRSATAIGNETRTLSALERLSVEIMAEALRLSGQATQADRLLVVPSAQGRPPILMLMSPNIESVQKSHIISNDLDLPLASLQKVVGEAVEADGDGPEAKAFRELRRADPRSLAQLFFIAQPEVVLTRRPRMMPLCVPSAHMRIELGEEISTAGVFCRDLDGDFGVTGCFHGTGPVGTEVTVGLRKSQVKHASGVQDLVFIPLGNGFNIPAMAGLGGVLEDREPAKSAWAHFDGATNQNCRTRVISTDAGMLRARPTIMLKLQTDPDTDQGDRGSALLDEHDNVLGFAFERTAPHDHPQFTDWIWAANALRALGLTPHK
jgi:hypothetical protein